MKYRYYCLKRPPMLGGLPKGTLTKAVCFPEHGLVYEQEYVEEIHRDAWGYVEYKEPLTAEQISEYDMLADPRNGTDFDDNNF